MTRDEIKCILCNAEVAKAFVEKRTIQVRNRHDPNDKWEDFNGKDPDFGYAEWEWRIKPEPKTVEWGPEDVPPVCWVRFKKSFAPDPSARWLVTRFDKQAVCITPTCGSLQFISYQELKDKCEYSTDLKTWKPCTKTIEQ